MEEAAKLPDIVEIAISTRPDCIREDYLDVMEEIADTCHISIGIELGLQTANYHTLKEILWRMLSKQQKLSLSWEIIL